MVDGIIQKMTRSMTKRMLLGKPVQEMKQMRRRHLKHRAGQSFQALSNNCFSRRTAALTRLHTLSKDISRAKINARIQRATRTIAWHWAGCWARRRAWCWSWTRGIRIGRTDVSVPNVEEPPC